MYNMIQKWQPAREKSITLENEACNYRCLQFYTEPRALTFKDHAGCREMTAKPYKIDRNWYREPRYSPNL